MRGIQYISFYHLTKHIQILKDMKPGRILRIKLVDAIVLINALNIADRASGILVHPSSTASSQTGEWGKKLLDEIHNISPVLANAIVAREDLREHPLLSKNEHKFIEMGLTTLTHFLLMQKLEVAVANTDPDINQPISFYLKVLKDMW